MKVKARATLPPWVDVVCYPDRNKDYWMSSAIPWLPVSDYYDDNEFDGLVITALLHRGAKTRHLVELRLERRRFMFGDRGASAVGDSGQTIAFGVMPLDKFIEATKIRPDLKVWSRSLIFYENGCDVMTYSISRDIPCDPNMIAKICRGWNRPRRFTADDRCNMRFEFSGCEKSFVQWRERLMAV